MDEVYKRICDKLGCEPKDIAIPEFNTEDDSWESPFKVLTNEEMNYIVNHGCLPGIEWVANASAEAGLVYATDAATNSKVAMLEYLWRCFDMAVDKEYERICKKLGFIPSEYKYDGPIEEDDTWVNPFSVLTVEENDYLYENGYLYQK